MQANNRAKKNAMMEEKNQYEVSHAMEKMIKESGMNKNRLEPNLSTISCKMKLILFLRNSTKPKFSSSMTC